MTPPPSPESSAADWSAYYTQELQLALTPLKPGTKVPLADRWNTANGYIRDPAQAEQYWREHPEQGMGAVLNASRLVALDVDDTQGAAPAFRAAGLDLATSVRSGCRIASRPGRAKALFRAPDVPLELRKLTWPQPDDPTRRWTIVELRAGALQDVLPPSVHPDTHRAYTWKRGPWETDGFPPLPEDLLRLWMTWDEHLPALLAACPWAEPAPALHEAMPPPARAETDPWTPVRHELLQRLDLDERLRALGAEPHGSRSWRCPFHDEKRPSFWTFQAQEGHARWVDAHGGAPVGREDARGYSCGDALDLFAYERGLDLGAATAAAARGLGIPLPSDDDGARIRVGGRCESGTALTRVEAPWPPPLAEAAYHGLVGQFVRLVEPTTEADPAALLIPSLVAFGSVVGRGPHFRVEADEHHLNEYAALVGKTSKARKGTSWGRVRALFALVDPDWVTHRVVSGLSSGEGFAYAVRDPVTKHVPSKRDGKATGEYDEEVVDIGVPDKRLLVQENEFASVLGVLAREGNILSPALRDAWDGRTLGTLTKNNPVRATNPHVSVLAHITAEELRRRLDSTEIANGLANRFLFVCVARSKLLPEGGHLAPEALAPLAEDFQQAVTFARQVGAMERDAEARTLWAGIYPRLRADRLGLFGSLTARTEAHGTRLACLYALLDQSAIVRAEHLLAALAVWDYVEASIRHLFGDATGDPVADAIRGKLQRDGAQARTDISRLFARNQPASRLDTALALLEAHGLAQRRRETATGGAPREVWEAV